MSVDTRVKSAASREIITSALTRGGLTPATPAWESAYHFCEGMMKNYCWKFTGPFAAFIKKNKPNFTNGLIAQMKQHGFI